MPNFVAIVDGCFLAFAIGRLLYTLPVWYRSQRLSPESFSRTREVVLEAILSSRSGIQVLAVSAFCCLAPPLVVHLGQMPNRELLIWAGALLGLSGIPVLLRTPVILVLGSSNQGTRGLIAAVGSAVVPLRVVGLFDRERMMDNSFFFRAQMACDNLRTWDNSMWRCIVDDVSDIVPVIIMDARVVTPDVLYEASNLLRSTNRPKAVWFAQPNGDAPLLDAIGVHAVSAERSDLRMVQNYDELTAALQAMSLPARKVPQRASNNSLSGSVEDGREHVN